jgi:outer membrane protein TolC
VAADLPQDLESLRQIVEEIMRYLWIALTIAATISASMAGEAIVGQRSRRLSLDDAVQLALRQNPNILAQIQVLKEQKGLVYQAQARLFPQLTAAANYNQQDPALVPSTSSTSTQNLGFDLLALPTGQPFRFNPATGQSNLVAVPLNELLGSNRVTPTESWQVTLTVTQLIWDGGATIASRRGARIQEDAAYYSLRDIIDQVVATVRNQFYQILLNRALIQVQEESVNLLQNQLNDQRSRFEAGTVPQFNVLQAEVALQNQIPQLISARNNYRISQLNLARTLGIPADKQYASDEPLPVVGILGFNPIKYDLATALATARTNRPFLKAQRSNILSNVENITVAAAGFQPTVTADAGLEQASSGVSRNLKDTREGWFFGVQGSWNVFDGGLTYGRVKQARGQLEQSKVTYDDSVRQVELEVSTAVSNLRQSQETVLSAQKAIQQAREALRLSEERLAAGTGTQLDVLDARTQLTTSQTNLVQAQFNYQAAIDEFQRSTATETFYNNEFDSPQGHPSTLTQTEAGKSSRARFDSPLDPNKPATRKSKKESLIPPRGKVQLSTD